MMLGGEPNVVIDLSFRPIVEKHPYQAISPNPANITPRNGRNQYPKANDHGGNRLGNQNGGNQDLGWIRLTYKGFTRSNDKQSQVPSDRQLDIDERLDLTLIQFPHQFADQQHPKGLHDPDQTQCG